MSYRDRLFAALLPMLCFLSAPAAAKAEQAASFEWRLASPESQGMSKAKLDALKDSLAATKTKAFLVIRNDKVVCEWYAPDHSATKPHYTASMAKGIVGGLSLAVALTDGRIALDHPASKYVPQWKDDPNKSAITIRHLGSHTSGIEDAEADGLLHEKLTGWKGDFWKRLDPPRDPFTISRDIAPVLFKPGAKFHYSNPGIAMMTYAVTAALETAPHTDVRTLLRERIMRPIGVSDEQWAVGYGKTYTVDGRPLVGSWGGGNYTARAIARIGRLLLREGNWEGRQLISEGAVRQITSDAGLPGNCGMGWWRHTHEGQSVRLPRDAFFAAGAGHQILLVVPSLKLIMARSGGALAEIDGDASPSKYHEPVRQVLFDPLLDACGEGRASQPPYPRSMTIKEAWWGPKESIIREARDSDNWPVTWADDDALYTAYGDGRGFEPKVSRKLSLGFAKISGGPNDFLGTNILSNTGEHYGEGAAGLKASGLLCVDGVLYLWARNATNSQLAWSIDHALSWTWARWRFTESFGCPTFLNFGKDYSGARDDFVYVYSHDSDSAYRPAGRMVLARVPKERIRDRMAYEFFVGVDAQGQPSWSREISKRESIFTHPKRCLRSQITYCAPLKRYLWWQQAPNPREPADTRFEGGFGIYDAPEPWGPWTTVFFTEKWDTGPGETASLPAKWMSADGRTMHLVFSGDDSFSVRRVSFVVGDQLLEK